MTTVKKIIMSSLVSIAFIAGISSANAADPQLTSSNDSAATSAASSTDAASAHHAKSHHHRAAHHGHHVKSHHAKGSKSATKSDATPAHTAGPAAPSLTPANDSAQTGGATQK